MDVKAIALSEAIGNYNWYGLIYQVGTKVPKKKNDHMFLCLARSSADRLACLAGAQEAVQRAADNVRRQTMENGEKL